MTELHVLHSVVAIEIDEPEERKSTGGIILPDQHESPPMEGKVVSLGKGAWVENNKTKKMERETFQVIEGDTVIFSPASTIELEVDGRVIHLLKEESIIGIVV